MRLLLIGVMVLAGCGGGSGDEDAGSDAMDAGSDAGKADAGDDEIDAGSIDAGSSDAGSSDAGSDAGIDCSTIGCGPPVVCGEACAEPCGCCACAEGEEMTAGEVTYVCAGGCWRPRDGGGGVCESDADCGPGFSCCYPCGIEGCMNICEPTCEEGEPGCAGGCLLRP